MLEVEELPIKRDSSGQETGTAKKAGLYNRHLEGKGRPAPELENFRVEGRDASEEDPVTGRDWEMQGEPGGQLFCV